jgi:hypothetical protein
VRRSLWQSRRAAAGRVDAALVEEGPVEGHAASVYEPTPWPNPRITPDPYEHLTHRQGGGTNEHNHIEGALGVQSAAIPWDHRHYAGNLNSHRKAEPLIYTPLFVAKSPDGESAVDLTSLVNREYWRERMSKRPQYLPTLSIGTDYKPVQLHPTDHWLPQMPKAAPGVSPKYWEQHFLDLYAPTPPPLRSPRVPGIKRQRKAGQHQQSMLETAAVAPLPSILTHGEQVHPLITPMLDAHQRPVPFHDVDAEDDAQRRARDVDLREPLAHANDIASFMELDEQVSSEMESEEELPADAVYDVSVPFPPAVEEQEALPW